MADLAKDKPQSSAYRPEIDGLRALAVVAVIINHMNQDLLPSGYLGVDIFFVISGYVITSSLLRKNSTSLADFLVGFYVRRIKRLIPALAFFVVITSVLISLVNPEPRVSLGIGWRSLFGISNIQLYNVATDYFASSTELNPFIHTWSLGVEEQFYVLFPLLVWFSGFGRQTKNGPRNLFLIAGFLSLASLISFVYLYSKNQAAAYFLMPPRFWEMAVGCLVFLALYRRAGFASLLKRIPSLLILFLLVAVLFLPNTVPVPATFAVVLLTMLLIGSLQQGSITYRLLTIKMVLKVGLISYSLYLWHWGVLSLSRWTIGIHWWSVPIVIGLMLMMAFFSYYFIETPFRAGVNASRTIILATGVALILGSFAAVQSISKVFSTRLYLDRSEPLLKRLPQTNEIISNCNVYNNTELECGYRDSANLNTIFLLGDSHIDQFADQLLSFAKKHGYNLVRATGGGCPFPVTPAMQIGDHCRRVQEQIKQNVLQKAKSGDIVFFGTAVTGYFLPSTSKDGESSYPRLKPGVNASEALADFKEVFMRLSRKLNDKNVRLVFFLDGPRFPDVLESYGFCKSPWFAPKRGEHPGCFVDKEAFLTWRNLNFGWLNSWSDNRLRFVMDGTTDKVCKGEKCSAENYIDSNHFDRFYASYVFDSFISRPGKALTSP
jgi:peptidoglycan/LPS O-acetylase OafA/YrhL